MKWLALDPSSRTGYAIFEGSSLLEYGLLTKEINGFKSDVSNYTQLAPEYPMNYIEATSCMAKDIMTIIKDHGIEYVVLEHTESSMHRFSQRYLEWLHMALILSFAKNKIKFQYLLNSDWRKAAKCYLKDWPEYDKHNKEVRKLKKKATPTKSGAKVAKNEAGKIVTIIDQKKLSMLVASKYVGCDIDNDNTSDAILLGVAAMKLGLV
jgi:hypothetical protein